MRSQSSKYLVQCSYSINTYGYSYCVGGGNIMYKQNRKASLFGICVPWSDSVA